MDASRRIVRGLVPRNGKKRRKSGTIAMSEETKSGSADSDKGSYYQQYFSTSGFSIVNLPNPVGKKPWTRHTQAILKAEIISSLKFLDSFEPAGLSFEVFRPLRVPAFPLPFA